ncbi:MAG TPA: GNAT family N-acetyltransferase [Rhizomicrobium sp.]|nr:GNAT family N-acetyltransferase [Rhizomicrobium sp.]
MPHSRKKSILDEPVRKSPPGKYKLDELNADRIAKHLVMFQPDEKTLAEVIAKARFSIPGIAKMEEVFKVARYQPACMMAVARRSRFDPKVPVAEGLIAVLPLNVLGLKILALGAFDATKPDLRLLAKPGERPAGIYLWCVYLPGSLAAGMALLMERLSSDQNTGVNIYARPVTEDGKRFSQVLGFTQGVTIDGIEAADVWIFSRKSAPPLYDSYVPDLGKDVIGITIARTFDDLMRVAAIRNSVYIGEQECPYSEEYDGNDFAAVHLLAYIGDEPVGCLRLRFFADFAKFERMAIRKEYRKSRAAIQLARAGFKFCQKKGYRRVYGHIQERLVGFWSRFGFRVRENTRRFAFSDFEYVEIVADIERDPDAVTLDADPYLVIRPEGRWHIPGILEKSSARAATKTMAAKKR